MAGLVKGLGRTRLGLWLWVLAKRNPAAGLVVFQLAAGLRAVEWAVQRRRPANRRHDQVARSLLLAFDAETRSQKRDSDL